MEHPVRELLCVLIITCGLFLATKKTHACNKYLAYAYLRCACTLLTGALHYCVTWNSLLTKPCTPTNPNKYKLTVVEQNCTFVLCPLQVPGSMMDMNVLMACQLLLEQVFNEGNSLLLQQLYQHLLFSFRIWTKSHFAVCLGKAQEAPMLLTNATCEAFYVCWSC